MTRPSIVITGRGLATCLGLSAGEVFDRVARGECGIGPMRALEQRPREDKGGGQAVDLPEDEGARRGERDESDIRRAARYLRYVIRRALIEAGIGAERGVPVEKRRCVLLGTTLHGMRAGGVHLRTGSEAALRRFLAGDVLDDALEGLPAGFSIGGLRATTSSACSSGLGSIALGVTLLEAGEADLVIAGGYDSVSEYSYAGFDSLRLIASGALRPFARDRQGMKVAEGYAVFALEREADAAARGARMLARVAGFGESADAHHLTQPNPDGSGAARAILAALERAGINPKEIDLISAHATATPGNDAAEHAAMKLAFGDLLGGIAVTAFKSHLGHTLGGAGAVELAMSLEAMLRGTVPPVANMAAGEVEFEGLDVVTGRARLREIRHTANLSLGFGGANTCVVLARMNEPERTRKQAVRQDRSREACISGIGVLLPGVVGREAFVALARGKIAARVGAMLEEEYGSLLNARRVRRMSEYVKLMLAAANAASADAGISNPSEFCENACAILGTTHGSTGYCEAYYTQIVREGMEAANPLLFAEGVPNAGAAQLSMMLGIRGGCQTIIGSRGAGLDALRLAELRIRTGECGRVFVGAAEEYSPMVERMYGQCDGGHHSAGSVAFVIETRESIEARGARAIAPVAGAVRLAEAGSGAVRLKGLGDVFSIGPLLSIVAGLGTKW